MTRSLFRVEDMESDSSDIDWDKVLINSAVLGDWAWAWVALVNGGSVKRRKDGIWTPLIGAAMHGHTDLCWLLLAHGSQLEEREFGSENTALHEAAVLGHLSTITALLNWTPEKAEMLVNLKNKSGYTPLTVACQGGHLDCVLALLKAGAVPLPTNRGLWPTHVAAKLNNVAVVETLLDHGCDLELVGLSLVIALIFTFISFSAKC